MSKATSLQADFDPRSDVHGIADRRIVETRLGTHVPDAGKSGVDSDADADLLLGPKPKASLALRRASVSRMASAARTALLA